MKYIHQSRINSLQIYYCLIVSFSFFATKTQSHEEKKYLSAFCLSRHPPSLVHHSRFGGGASC